MQSSARVLHIGKYYPPFHGGIESFMAELLPALNTSDESTVGGGWEQRCLVHNHLLSLRLRQEQVESVVVDRSPAFGRLMFVPLAPLFGFHLYRIVKTWKPDILHVHMPNVSAFWVLVLRCCFDIPVVLHWHADVVASKFHRGLRLAYQFYRPFETSLLKRANRIIATSPVYLQSSEPLQRFRNKCQVVPLGLRDISLPKKTSQDANKFNILCIGRLSYYKGHAVLLQAMKSLQDCHLVLVGEGEEKSRLQQLVREQDLQQKVTLAGKVPYDQLNQLISDCDCVCLPSLERTEAFGVVLLEAMRAAKAVVVSRVEGSGMVWLVQQNVNGVLVQADNATDLANVLQKLADEPMTCKAMGDEGRRIFESRFGIAEIASNIAQVYKELLND